MATIAELVGSVLISKWPMAARESVVRYVWKVSIVPEIVKRRTPFAARSIAARTIATRAIATRAPVRPSVRLLIKRTDFIAKLVQRMVFAEELVKQIFAGREFALRTRIKRHIVYDLIGQVLPEVFVAERVRFAVI